MALLPRLRDAEPHADGEGPADDHEHQQRRGADHQRMAKVQLFHATGLAADEYHIHRGLIGWVTERG